MEHKQSEDFINSVAEIEQPARAEIKEAKKHPLEDLVKLVRQHLNQALSMKPLGEILNALEPGFELHSKSGTKRIIVKVENGMVHLVRIPRSGDWEFVQRPIQKFIDKQSSIEKILDSNGYQIFPFIQEDASDIASKVSDTGQLVDTAKSSPQAHRDTRDVTHALKILGPGFEVYSESGSRRIVLKVTDKEVQFLKRDSKSGEYITETMSLDGFNRHKHVLQRIVDPWGGEIFSKSA